MVHLSSSINAQMAFNKLRLSPLHSKKLCCGWHELMFHKNIFIFWDAVVNHNYNNSPVTVTHVTFHYIERNVHVREMWYVGRDLYCITNLYMSLQLLCTDYINSLSYSSVSNIWRSEENCSNNKPVISCLTAVFMFWTIFPWILPDFVLQLLICFPWYNIKVMNLISWW